MKKVNKVTVLPCMGLMTPTSNLTRQAAFILKEDLIPNGCNCLCIPALLRGVDEDIVMAEEYPIIVMDGCQERCGSGICSMLSLKPAARFSMIELIREKRMRPGPNRKCISEEGMRLVDVMVDRIKNVINDITSDDSYEFQTQQIVRDASAIANYERDPDVVLDYIKLKDGFSRPSDMPRIRCLEKAAESGIDTALWQNDREIANVAA